MGDRRRHPHEESGSRQRRFTSRPTQAKLVACFDRRLIIQQCKMGRSTGLEPATFGSTIRRSNQLSYDRQNLVHHYNLSLEFLQVKILIGYFHPFI